jgi:APA family basic amino acid/polyamine antiporter
MPNVERPHRAFGYPVVPASTSRAATVLLILFTYQTATTWPGLVIILAGLPGYVFWTRQARR